MDSFAREAFRLGTLSCFQHFKVEPRGREELLLTVYAGSGPRPSQPSLQPLRSSSALPPASPCNREASQWGVRENEATFLIGGYAHYNVPYVWVRTGHSLLGCFQLGTDSNFDAPMGLKSTAAWKSQTVHVWQIVAELIAAAASPSPHNPFALERGALERLAMPDAIFSSGALAAFLRELLVGSPPFAEEVKDDLEAVVAFHYARLPQLAELPSVAAQAVAPRDA